MDTQAILNNRVKNIHRCRSCLDMYEGTDPLYCSSICNHNFLNYKIRYKVNTLVTEPQLPPPICLFCGRKTSINYEYMFPPYFIKDSEDNFCIAICRKCSMEKAEMEELAVYKEIVERGGC